MKNFVLSAFHFAFQLKTSLRTIALVVGAWFISQPMLVFASIQSDPENEITEFLSPVKECSLTKVSNDETLAPSPQSSLASGVDYPTENSVEPEVNEELPENCPQHSIIGVMNSPQRPHPEDPKDSEDSEGASH